MIAVGCPVKNRAWALPDWLCYVERAFDRLGETPFFVFVVGSSMDDTAGLIDQFADDRNTSVIFHDEEPTRGMKRRWNVDRYGHMVEARNLLLGLVREVKPDYFLSLDSDIMLNEQALIDMLETIKTADAVGGKVYLMEPPALAAPSYANITKHNALRRPDHSGVLPRVDVLMAVKLMTPKAYNVDYRTHFHGEDIGWSLAAAEAGCTLKWDGRSCSKHVMHPELLDQIDQRVGY